MPTYTFSCSCGWQGDKRAGLEDYVLPCPACQAPASRASVYSINFAGFTSTPLDQRTYHQEYKDFRDAGAELEYKHQRLEEAVGHSLPTPPLARMAKARAQELIAKGVTSSEDYQSRLKH
ncbi:MAG: hypothetical protein NUW01_07095 [Gemmatimonadaceae bacterium]|nr:hypothetical protein [Gemmatimonadaceae bacterium]